MDATRSVDEMLLTTVVASMTSVTLVDAQVRATHKAFDLVTIASVDALVTHYCRFDFGRDVSDVFG